MLNNGEKTQARVGSGQDRLWMSIWGHLAPKQAGARLCRRRDGLDLLLSILGLEMVTRQRFVFES